MLNRVILMGRLTADPEHKQTPNGVSVTSFSIAVDRNFNGKDGNRQTDFINIVAWRQTADFVCRYFTKGRMIALEGSIQTRNYEDRNGNKRTAFEVVADQVYFADSNRSNENGGNNYARPAATFPTPAPGSFSEPSRGTTFSVGGFNSDDFDSIDDDGDLPF